MTQSEESPKVSYPELPFEEFAAKYEERSGTLPEQLRVRMSMLVNRYDPEGFVLFENHQMNSHRFGEAVIAVYGPNNTFKELPASSAVPLGPSAAAVCTPVAYIRAASIWEQD